jgi:hypothetical protein
MQLCIGRQGWAAAVVRYRRMEQTSWRELEPLQAKGDLLALRNGQARRLGFPSGMGSVKDCQPTPIQGAISVLVEHLLTGRRFSVGMGEGDSGQQSSTCAGRRRGLMLICPHSLEMAQRANA